MHNDEPISCANADWPRHPHQEIGYLLAVALLRLRDKGSASERSARSDEKGAVGLGCTANQRLNANPYQKEGVRA